MLMISTKIGEAIIETLREIGRIVLLGISIFRWMFTSLPDKRVFVRQMYFLGVESLPVMIATGAFTGMVLAYNSYFELNRLGVGSWVGPLLTEALVEQLGPVLCGLMLAGRVGCSIAAELGTMSVTEQLDALTTMGVDPVRYLVYPRVLAAITLAPILTIYAMLVGIAAGFSLCIYGLGADAHYMWVHTKQFLTTYDIMQGLIKATFFGGTIALICCYKGINTTGGAEGVGKSTTSANVSSCTAILVLNLILTMILYLLDPA